MITNISCVGDFSPAETPIQIAVYTLSPVIIQTLIPAFLIFERQSWMSYCNLSSTPVIPKSSISCSKDSTTFSIDAVLFIMVDEALSYYFFQSRYSFYVKYFCASTKVLKPYRDKSSHSSKTKPLKVYETLSFMTESAPFK